MSESTQPTFRQSLERVSRPALVRLTALPRFLIPVATLALVAVGAFAPLPVAVAAFALVFLFISWITYLSWTAVTTGGKVLRVAMLALIVVLAVTRL